MWKYFKLIFVSFLLNFQIYALYAQDPVYSQFFASPLILNPAFAGNTTNPFVSFQYRNQWPSLNAYVTYSATYDQSLPLENAGVGLAVMSDDAGNGIYKTNSAYGMFSYKVALTDNFNAKIGVEAGAIQTRLNWDRLVFYDQLDPRYGTLNSQGNPNISQELRPEQLSKTILDIGSGILFYTPKWYAGASFKHLTSPDVNYFSKNDNLFVGLPMRYTVHAGAQIPLDRYNNGDVFISPNAMYVRQGQFSQLNIGAYAGFGKFFAGAWYRHAGTNTDAAILSAGFQQDIIKVGYAYDITLSGLAGQSGGSHEIFLSLNFDNTESARREQKARNMQDCFKMFR
jgi:type IX secretion system PorP/SprF family membrane protein